MSAWIVSENHIRILVEALYKYEIIPTVAGTQPAPDELGQLLWRENHKSINYCYSERGRTPHYSHESAAQCYDHQGKDWGTVREVVRAPEVVFKLAGCYRYQTCEHPTWERSQAHTLIEALKKALCKSMGMTEEEAYTGPAFDRGPWGVV